MYKYFSEIREGQLFMYDDWIFEKINHCQAEACQNDIFSIDGCTFNFNQNDVVKINF